MPQAEYIKYLNISQSLEDIKNFIEKINEQFNLKDSNWIIAGCFYSGTLAALARQRFPSLIKGAVAVSAPLKASLYIDFMDAVIEKMKAINENKTIQIQNAIETYYNYTATFEGQEYLGYLLKDDYIMSTNETECYPEFYDPTKFFANAIQDGTIVEFFEKWNNDSFETFMKLIVDIGKYKKFEKSEGHQQQKLWQHQLCTEFGYFRTTSSQKSLDFFGDSIPKICPELICDQFEKDVFLNAEYTFEDSISGIEKTNQLFGVPEKFNV
uniref:Uncharacterized protein n=1 Tax=Panagrolaimus davidi TaxID=227884 RepID=A0A914PPK4_9BILA